MTAASETLTDLLTENAFENLSGKNLEFWSLLINVAAAESQKVPPNRLSCQKKSDR
jgi:hypothetical protein